VRFWAVRRGGVRQVALSGRTHEVGGTLFLSADDGHGPELWRSDGTAAGTSLVRDIRTEGSFLHRGSRPTWLTNVGGTLFFSADDGTNGYELWKAVP
jgi:ELWxxDGT repeat protein